MICNNKVAILFIDQEKTYLAAIKSKLEQGDRLPDEKIHLVHSLLDGLRLLQKNRDIEVIVLHTTKPTKIICKALTELRQVTLAHIVVLCNRKKPLETADLYAYGADLWKEPPANPVWAAPFFEACYRRFRRQPGSDMLTGMEKIRQETKMLFGVLSIDPYHRTVYRRKKELRLTSREFDLLFFMAANEGLWLTYDALAEHVWKDQHVASHAITSCVHRLRSKIGTRYIQTQYGIGYRFVSE